ncbi:DUF2278 family protein [Sorangium sp. So ce693]|uniref:DUF2278 family protein n=1 Tax=Sorangium sp. So ce693 TaxID=3133318 RepID=UPI003F63E87E
MPLKSYGVLKGTVIDRRLASGANPHYQIHVVDDTIDYRIAVNVQSQDGSQVEYVVKSHFAHPLLQEIHELTRGFHRLESKPGGLGLDFIRGNLVDRTEFVPLPFSAPGPDNDLNEKLDHYVQRAMADETALLYAFGERWGPESGTKDKIFGFLPGNGIHDIHMNQGNDARFKKDDGVWQDGGLLIHFPRGDQWVAIFMKFQTQAWHTDDQTGHTLDVPVSGPPSDETGGGGGLPTVEQPDGIVRIVAALVNDVRTPERETVTLLNTSNQKINLAGWSLADKAKSKMALTGELQPGGLTTVVVQAPMVLSNKGGLITLLNAEGLKVDGVSYTKQQVSNPGWTIVF